MHTESLSLRLSRSRYDPESFEYVDGILQQAPNLAFLNTTGCRCQRGSYIEQVIRKKGEHPRSLEQAGLEATMPAQLCMILERKLAAEAEQKRRFRDEGTGSGSGSQLRKLGLLRLETSRLRCGRLVNEPLVEGLRRATHVRVLEVEAVRGAVLEGLPPLLERLYIGWIEPSVTIDSAGDTADIFRAAEQLADLLGRAFGPGVEQGGERKVLQGALWQLRLCRLEMVYDLRPRKEGWKRAYPRHAQVLKDIKIKAERRGIRVFRWRAVTS